MKNNAIANRLKEVIEKKNINKVDVANNLDTPMKNLYRYLNGQRVPTNEWLFKFARYYNVDITWLLFGTRVKLDMDAMYEFLDTVNKKELYEYITHYKEPSSIMKYRKERGISFKVMRSYAKDWFGKVNGIYAN